MVKASFGDFAVTSFLTHTFSADFDTCRTIVPELHVHIAPEIAKSRQIRDYLRFRDDTSLLSSAKTSSS